MKKKTQFTKRLVSIFLCLAMLLTYVPTTVFGAIFDEVPETADDLTVTIDTGASVTLKDTDDNIYYEIGTADELYAFAAAVNSGRYNIYGELTADIVVNEDVLTADGSLNGSGSDSEREPERQRQIVKRFHITDNGMVEIMPNCSRQVNSDNAG